MPDKIKLSDSSIKEAVTSGQRSMAVHEAFSSDAARLVFGKTETGKIVHVTQVERGLAANVFCPACAERLIARQGKKKAWHYAHANGHACRDALSASLSSWLAQCLQEDNSLLLPELTTPWGKSNLPDRDPEPIGAGGAYAERIQGETGPFRVTMTTKDSARSLRILFRTAKSSHTPSQETMERDGISTMLIDIYTPLNTLFKDNPDATIEPAWITHALLSEAPRRWLWNRRSAQKRETLRKQRLSFHLAVLSRFEAIEPESEAQEMTKPEVNLDRYGLLHLADTPPIPGERFLGPTPRSWRAAIVSDLLLQPFSTMSDEIFLQNAAFGRRKIVSSIAIHNIVLCPQLFRPLSRDDEMELKYIISDLKRPLDVVESYLVQLAKRGILKSSTRKAKAHRLPPSAIMSNLDGIPNIDWIASEDIINHAMRVAAAETLLKSSPKT